MFKIILCVFLGLFLFQESQAHTYHLGECPTIEPMYNFNMNKILGVWYVIQKTSTGSSCLTYNFTKTDEPNEYYLEQTSQHLILGLTPLKHEYHYTGTLKVPDTAIPARMTVKFPLSVAGKSSFTVFMTDYENYLAIFTCQKLAFSHRQSATILSRTKTMDAMYLNKIRSKLSSYNIDPYDLSIISQKDCPKNGTEAYDINIDQDTFTAQSAAGVIRKAGEKLGDGIEYVAGKAKDTYHHFKDKDVEDTTKQTEWLP